MGNYLILTPLVKIVRFQTIQKYVRDGKNPLEYYNEVEFKSRYRFSKDATMNGFFPLIGAELIKDNNHGLPISPIFQLLVCSRFYATASFQVQYTK